MLCAISLNISVNQCCEMYIKYANALMFLLSSGQNNYNLLQLTTFLTRSSLAGHTFWTAFGCAIAQSNRRHSCVLTANCGRLMALKIFLSTCRHFRRLHLSSKFPAIMASSRVLGLEYIWRHLFLFRNYSRMPKMA